MSKAVFLSYASQDAEAARRICEALRSGGIEVWFDQSELRGGDAWDQKIRREIRDCGLFIPVISLHTDARPEGYFRLEWKLAVDRSHLMADDEPFLLPVVVDDIPEATARVPDKFRQVQWMRLYGGETPPVFVQRVARLLAHDPQAPTAPNRPPAAAVPRTGGSWLSRRGLLLIAALAAIGLGYLAVDKFILATRPAARVQTSAPTGQSPAPAPSAIPEKSIAVLPFVNMSSDKEQEYFSDGLSEELINLLTKVPDLRVPARTSSFYFKGKSDDIPTIAQRLRVAHVLEGSVRKSGNTIRVTAQLIRADNGYHLWSETYDRDTKDIFKVQDEIAAAVVAALKVKLAAGVQVTGSRRTTNTEAYNEYLLGRQFDRPDSLEGYRHAVEAYANAIALDPNYAAAYAGLAVAESFVADLTGDAGGIERAGHDVDKAIALAPTDANGYAARSYIRTVWLWDWSGAQADIERALILDPRSSDVQHRYAGLLESLGRLPEAIAAQKNATELDPLSSKAWQNLGRLYKKVGDYAQANAALGRAIEIEPTSARALNNLGTLRLLQGKDQEALATFRQNSDDAYRLYGIAMVEHTLGRDKESQQALDELMAKHAQEGAYQIAEVFAWRGEKDRAFEWLERAYKQQDGGLSTIKTDLTLKSLHSDPRFNALLRKMNLPE